MCRAIIVPLAVACSLALFAGGCGSDRNGNLTSGGGGDANAIVASMKEFYRNQSSYRVETDLTVIVKDMNGTLIPSGGPPPESRTFVIQAPNKLAFRTHAGIGLVTDGRESVVFVENFGKFWRGPAPHALEELTQPPFMFLFLGPDNMRAILLAVAPDKAIARAGVEFEVVGEEQVGGMAAVHLRTKSANVGLMRQATLELWIAREGDPLLLKTVLTEPPRQFAPQVEGIVTHIEEFHDWEFAPDLSDDDFTFQKPDGARRVDNLMSVLEPDPPLLGQPAPAVELPLLGGGVLKLEELAGKIVLLDFWATWCGPCLVEMPIVAKVVEDYADRGVELYAVNVEEDAETVSRFLERSPLNLTVALDQTTRAKRAFEVDGIPHLVIIGTDGTIQVIHVGFSEALEPILRQELDHLLAGLNLARDGVPDEPVPAESRSGASYSIRGFSLNDRVAFGR